MSETGVAMSETGPRPVRGKRVRPETVLIRHLGPNQTEQRPGMTLQQVADELGLSKERVRQIEGRALLKLARMPCALTLLACAAELARNRYTENSVSSFRARGEAR